jgi:hypothetical protein
MTPDVTPYDPKVVIMNLLADHWNDDSVTTEYADRWDDFEWRIDDHFDTNWIHTGWYDNSSNNPQVSVIFDSSNPGTSTGYDATTGTGGKSAQLENTAYIDTWVQSNREQTGGINPKMYAWQLRLRCELIILDHAEPGGDHPWQFLGTGEIRSPEEPEETPIGSRWRIPVLFADQKRT